MYVIHMSFKVAFIADHVIPISALPDAPFSRPRPGGRIFAFGNFPREQRFDTHPANREIFVMIGQTQNAMQMVRQNTDCQRLKRPVGFHLPPGIAQVIYPFDQQTTLSVLHIDREETRPTG